VQITEGLTRIHELTYAFSLETLTYAFIWWPKIYF